MDLLIKKIADILKDEIMKSGIRRKEGETELRILVQSSQAGAIIGTKGTTVKTLREVTSSNTTPENPKITMPRVVHAKVDLLAPFDVRAHIFRVDLEVS